jgi:hypothetical protein
VPLPFTASPRRTRGLAFTCNVCGERTTRRVNPGALETGTTFVQCSNESCLVYHKVADNLGLFHELKARGGACARRASCRLRAHLRNCAKTLTVCLPGSSRAPSPPEQGPVYPARAPRRAAAPPPPHFASGGFDVLDLEEQ